MNKETKIKKIKIILKQLLKIKKELFKLGWYENSPLTNNIEEVMRPLKYTIDVSEDPTNF